MFASPLLIKSLYMLCPPGNAKLPLKQEDLMAIFDKCFVIPKDVKAIKSYVIWMSSVLLVLAGDNG